MSPVPVSLFFAKLVIDTVKISFSFASSAAFITSEVSPESEIKISKLIIYRNDSLYREEELTQLKDTTYTYKWEKVESGSYSFEVVD